MVVSFSVSTVLSPHRGRLPDLLNGETIVYQEKKSKPVLRKEPKDFCKIGHDEVTLMLNRSFWYTIVSSRLMNFIDEIVPSTATKEAYEYSGSHGVFAFLNSTEAYELHDRMELEGGFSKFLRVRGLLS